MKAPGIVKLSIIGLNTVLIIFLWPLEPNGFLTSPLIPFIFMSVLIPFYYLAVRKVKDDNLKWPDWNTNLFNPKTGSPFGNIDFFGALFTAIGLSMIVSNKVNYNAISNMGLTSLSFGLGILFGLLLTILVGKKIGNFKY